MAAKGKCAIALASASVQGEGARQGPHLVGWQGACVLLLMCSCKCSGAIASVLGAIVAKFSGGRFTESTLLVAPTQCSPPALNLAKGCRARSEQRGARMISTLPKVFLRGCPAILVPPAYLLHNKESCYIFCLATTSLIDMEIAWPVHYEQLD